MFCDFRENFDNISLTPFHFYQYRVNLRPMKGWGFFFLTRFIYYIVLFKLLALSICHILANFASRTIKSTY